MRPRPIGSLETGAVKALLPRARRRARAVRLASPGVFLGGRAFSLTETARWTRVSKGCGLTRQTSVLEGLLGLQLAARAELRRAARFGAGHCLLTGAQAKLGASPDAPGLRASARLQCLPRAVGARSSRRREARLRRLFPLGRPNHHRHDFIQQWRPRGPRRADRSRRRGARQPSSPGAPVRLRGARRNTRASDQHHARSDPCGRARKSLVESRGAEGKRPASGKRSARRVAHPTCPPKPARVEPKHSRGVVVDVCNNGQRGPTVGLPAAPELVAITVNVDKQFDF